VIRRVCWLIGSHPVNSCTGWQVAGGLAINIALVLPSFGGGWPLRALSGAAARFEKCCGHWPPMYEARDWV